MAKWRMMKSIRRGKNGEWLNDLSFSNITILHSPATANEQGVWKSVARWESVSQNIRLDERFSISDRFFICWKNVEDCLGNYNRIFRFDVEKIFPYNFLACFSFNIWKVIFFVPCDCHMEQACISYGDGRIWKSNKLAQSEKTNTGLICWWFCCSR